MTFIGAILTAATVTVVPEIALLGAFIAGFGLMGWRGGWSDPPPVPRRALPFPVTHDPPDPFSDAFTFDRNIVLVRLELQSALDGPSREAVGAALPVLVHAHIDGATITLTNSPRTETELFDLLSRWGRAVHERFGIAGVHVSWSRLSGPPPSL